MKMNEWKDRWNWMNEKIDEIEWMKRSMKLNEYKDRWKWMNEKKDETKWRKK